MPEQMGLFETIGMRSQESSGRELEKERSNVVKTPEEDIEAFKSFTIELEERKGIEAPAESKEPVLRDGDPEQIAEKLLAEASRNPMPVFTSVIPVKV